MSIRLKLLAGCICLTVITLLVGLFAQSAQQKIGTLAVQIYDDALLSTNALRSAQAALIRMEADLNLVGAASEEAGRPAGLDEERTAYLRSAIGGILADLTTASDGSISTQGREATDGIRRNLAKIRAADGRLSERLLEKELAGLNDQLDAAVRIFQSDAYGVRRNVGDLIEETVGRTWAGMGLAIALAGVITLLLSRAIVPALRNAMSIAKSISEGKLDNDIRAEGSSEMAELLAALSDMQDSLSQHFGRIEGRAAHQADAYDSQISVQSARFEAALNNMTHGLCMFDAQQILVVYNRRFAAMFGDVELGQSLRKIAALPQLRSVLDTRKDEYSTHALDDGRMIAITRQAIVGGGRVMTFEDVTERQLNAERMTYMAAHDALTGLPNRVELRERLDGLIGESGWWKRMAMLSIDLRGFKFINDTLGHSLGDAFLKATSERLRGLVEPCDFVARVGGDEFAIVLTQASDQRKVEDLARRTIEAIGQSVELGFQTVSVGVSIGIVMSVSKGDRPPEDTADTLIKKADLALVAAKAKGRNTHCFFENEMEESIQKRRRTELDLAVALSRNEFEVYFQPFVNVAEQRVTGFEALLRWTHPERGPISPGEFIPIAEETGLIEALGLWVLDNACRQAADWPVDLSVSVNLSPVQFRSRTLYEDVVRTVRRSGLDPSRLQLEITESVLLHDTDSVLKILTAFRALGIRISMDDFGTGYSSLGYLSRFPFDKVKIDQSFVRDLSKRENIAVVRAVIGLSRAMGIAVIAEGVETEKQLTILLAEGCEEMQGYHFSRPKPVAELPQFLIRFAMGLFGEAKSGALRSKGKAVAAPSRIPLIQGS